MTKLFRSRGFDSLIAKGLTVHGQIMMTADSTLEVEGNAYLDRVIGDTSGDKLATKTTLRVSGILAGPAGSNELDIQVHNVVITGSVVCKTIRVEGTLAVKRGARLVADNIYYRNPIIEPGSIIHGNMHHLDHVSEGEAT